MPNVVPHRFSEAQFRRYEPILAQIQAAWPNVSIFDPGATGILSQETFTCRLRDAMTSFVRYSYCSGLILRDSFLEIYNEVIVAQKDGKVLVGPRSALKTHKTVQPIHSTSATVGQKNDVFTCINPSAATIHAFCLLLSQRLLTKPVLVEMLDPQLLLEVQEKYDIVAASQSDGSILIV